MPEPTKKPDIPENQAQGIPPQCTCVQDPFNSLPPELRPKPIQKIGGLRKVTCPGCGLIYWTNRKVDLCLACEKKGIQIAKEGG